MEYYEKASDHGCFDASWRLGDGYRDGIGVSRNIEQAEKLYRLAIEQCHHPEADGWGIARQRLGELLLFERECTEVEVIQAIDYLDEAARAKNEEALYLLALCFDEGIGVEQDKDTANQLFWIFINEFGDRTRKQSGQDEQDLGMKQEYLDDDQDLLIDAMMRIEENCAEGDNKA